MQFFSLPDLGRFSKVLQSTNFVQETMEKLSDTDTQFIFSLTGVECGFEFQHKGTNLNLVFPMNPESNEFRVILTSNRSLERVDEIYNIEDPNVCDHVNKAVVVYRGVFMGLSSALRERPKGEHAVFTV